MTCCVDFNSGVRARVETGVALAGLTSIGFGGPADYLVRPTGREDVRQLLEAARASVLPVRVMGRGTNLFVDDAGVPGLVMVIDHRTMNTVRWSGTRLTAGAGARLATLVGLAVKNGLRGLEALVGIPGSLGGAVRMNAGGAAGDIGRVTAAVTVIDSQGRVARLDRPHLRFGYRRSNLRQVVILEAEFELERADPEDLRRVVRRLWRDRLQRQPRGVRTAGCVFKNPSEAPAGRLIEEAGLKGTRLGGLIVSERHANFFINCGGGTFSDARRLIDLVRDRVRASFGIELELEVEVWRRRDAS